MKKTLIFIPIILVVILFFIFLNYSQAKINITDNILYNRLKGKIILQVEQNGEAYYVSPEKKEMYFLARPQNAFDIMRQQGIGIKNSDLEKIEISLDFINGQDSDKDGLSDALEDSLNTNRYDKDSDKDLFDDYTEIINGYHPNNNIKLQLDKSFAIKQAGKILLQVEQNGEAWYIHPDNYKRYFLARPRNAFDIMRNLGLGISNNDFSKMNKYYFENHETDDEMNDDKNLYLKDSTQLFGIMGVYNSNDFSKIKSLEAKNIGLINNVSSEELQDNLAKAKSLGLSISGRAVSRTQFQTTANKIDFDKLKALITNTFEDKTITENDNFSFYYIIDEPCHPDKWNISLAEFKQFYLNIKEIDPKIQVFINFGHLDCLDSFIPPDCSDWKITDIAAFTITEHKLAKYKDYIEGENATAAKAKKCNPDLNIVPMIAVYEYPERELPIPDAKWIKNTGLETLTYDNFDGLMYYPWSPSKYMGDTIEDVFEDTAYKNAFIEVFNNDKYNETKTETSIEIKDAEASPTTTETLKQKKPWISGIVFDDHGATSADLYGEHPLLSWVYVRESWANINPEKNVYNWESLEEKINSWSKYGKKIILGISPMGQDSLENNHTPTWIYDEGVSYISYNRNNEADSQLISVPKTWDKNTNTYDAKYFELFSNMLDALAEKYNNDKRIGATSISIGHLGGMTANPNPNGAIAYKENNWNISYYEDLVDDLANLYEKKFTNKRVVLNPTPLVLRDNNPTSTHELNYSDVIKSKAKTLAKSGISLWAIGVDQDEDRYLKTGIPKMYNELASFVMQNNHQQGLGDDWPMYAPNIQNPAGNRDIEDFKQCLDHAIGGFGEIPESKISFISFLETTLKASFPGHPDYNEDVYNKTLWALDNLVKHQEEE